MITKICPVCKRSFEVHPYRKDTAIYCSYKCAWKSKEKRFHKVCPICKKKFITKFQNQMFCSYQCSGKSRQTFIIKQCLNCGKKISVIPALINRKRYCSKKCKNLAQKETLRGKNNPFYGKYHTKEARRKIKKALRKRLKEGWRPLGKKGKDHPQFKGKTIRQGYVYLYQPFHPQADKHGNVKRANLVMEKMIGRFLKPEEIVHHKGVRYPISSFKNRGDDRPVNLQLFANKSEHNKFHYPNGFNPKSHQNP